MSHVERIDLEQARKRAKELLREWRADGRRAQLADAQRETARSLGFTSWPAMVEALGAVRTSTAERAARFVLRATSPAVRQAEALLASYPEIAHDGLYPALVLGDASRVEAAVDREPDLATRAGGPRDWVPLLYVCHSRFLGGERTEGLVSTARLLLDRGADANVGDPTPLYGAAGVAHEPRLTRLLLDAGADPNDGESLYHATEARDTECLRLLVERGANVTVGVLMHKLDSVDDVDGVRLLLEHLDISGAMFGRHHGQLWVGASPLHQAVLRGRSPGVVRLLLERGAEVEAVDGAGRTPYALAIATARTELAQLLAAHGARADHDPIDALVGACLRGDETTARRLAHLRDRLRPIDHEAVATAVRAGDVTATRLMLELGFDPNVPGELQATPLHFAAADGRPDLVGILLEHGANVDAVASHIDEQSTPLAWAVYASAGSAARDHATVVEHLVAAGAGVDSWMLGEADEEVAEVLREHAGA